MSKATIKTTTKATTQKVEVDYKALYEQEQLKNARLSVAKSERLSVLFKHDKSAILQIMKYDNLSETKKQVESLYLSDTTFKAKVDRYKTVENIDYFVSKTFHTYLISVLKA